MGVACISGMLSHFCSQNLTSDHHMPQRTSWQPRSAPAVSGGDILSAGHGLALHPKMRNMDEHHGTLSTLQSTACQAIALPRASPQPREEKHLGFMGFKELEIVRG